jgi:hypothetical protein
MKMTEKEAGRVLYVLRQAQIEMVTLYPRLSNPYRNNIKDCADLCKDGMKIMQDVIARGDDEVKGE